MLIDRQVVCSRTSGDLRDHVRRRVDAKDASADLVGDPDTGLGGGEVGDLLGVDGDGLCDDATPTTRAGVLALPTRLRPSPVGYEVTVWFRQLQFLAGVDVQDDQLVGAAASGLEHDVDSIGSPIGIFVGLFVLRDLRDTGAIDIHDKYLVRCQGSV